MTTSSIDGRTRLALVLAQVPGVDRRRLRRLLARAPDRGLDRPAALGQFCSDTVDEHAPIVLTADACRTAWNEGGRLADACERRGWHVWALGGHGYPECLLALADPPAVMFVAGPPRLPDIPRLAIVGTREPTGWGEAMSAACASGAVCAGALVVSGLAAGIDTAAHAAAVDRRGLTVATLPGGLDHVFPAGNRPLATRIVEAGGWLLSEYLPWVRPRPAFFVQRDRLQAALSNAVLVIETGRVGGTHHTIRFARALGRPVWVTLPESVVASPAQAAEGLPSAQQGTWDLWRQGCPAVSAEEVGRLVGEVAADRLFP